MALPKSTIGENSEILEKDESDSSDSESYADALDNLKLQSDRAQINTGDKLSSFVTDEGTERENEQKASEQDMAEDYIDLDFLKDRDSRLSEDELLQLQEKAKALKAEGNELFKRDEIMDAAKAYTDGLRVCPLKYDKDRAVMYSNRAACKVKLDERLRSIEDCTAAIDLDPDYVRCLLRRADLCEKEKKLDEALKDYEHLLKLDPSLHVARDACLRLPKEIEERNEEMKKEMFSKLKELGNMCLKPFGMSTDNFKFVQNPETGGYSVSFQNNSQ